MGSRGLGRWGSVLGWSGLATWVILAAWFLVAVVPDRGSGARGATREHAVVVAVHEATADGVVAGAPSETIYYPTLEYGLRSGGEARRQASYCFLRDRPEVGRVIDVVYDAVNAPCAQQGSRVGWSTATPRWPWALAGLGLAAVILSAAVARRAGAPGSVAPVVSLLAVLGIASFAGSLLLPLSRRGERPPLADLPAGFGGTGDVHTAWSWQSPGTLLVLGGIVLLAAHLRRGRGLSVVWLAPAGLVVALFGLVLQQASPPPGSGGDVATGPGLVASAFGLGTLGLAMGVQRVARPASGPADTRLPLHRAERAGIATGALGGFVLAVEVVVYVMFAGWADEQYTGAEKLQIAVTQGLPTGIVVGAALGAVAATVVWVVARRDTPGRVLLRVRLSASWLTATSVLLSALALVDNHGGWTTTNVLLGVVVAGSAGTTMALARR